nr:hypothetical protein [Rhodococcus qingshengii]
MAGKNGVGRHAMDLGYIDVLLEFDGRSLQAVLVVCQNGPDCACPHQLQQLFVARPGLSGVRADVVVYEYVLNREAEAIGHYAAV